MRVVVSPQEVRAASREWRGQGRSVGFVPTMGALHEGHLSLVDAAREAGADRIAASIFVNPTQFGPTEDLSAYPRDRDGDEARLRERGVDLLFRPEVGTIYPPDSQTSVSLASLPHHLCGLSRPVHFSGVATVVTLLFNIVEPDLAVFGEKDFQQLQVIRRMARDLHFPIRIVGAPIVREPDGLAMSSRNAYLRGGDRERALCLSRALAHAADRVSRGEACTEILVSEMRAICREAGRVDYVAIVDEDTLEPVATLTGPARAVLAVQIGAARLIDNARIGPGLP